MVLGLTEADWYATRCSQTRSPNYAGSQPRPPGRITSTTTRQSSGDWSSSLPRSAAAEASILTWPTASTPTTASLGTEGAAGRGTGERCGYQEAARPEVGG